MRHKNASLIGRESATNRQFDVVDALEHADDAETGVGTVGRLCVFAGAAPGSNPLYMRAAQRTGRALADQRVAMVYGGAGIGLMGALAKGVLEGLGEVIGVIPQYLADLEVAHRGLTRLEVVDSMHERKARMSELADGYLALPGGLGTLEELFEVWTWAQLGLHRRPCALLNVDGYFDPLLTFLDKGVDAGFLSADDRSRILVDDDLERLIEELVPALTTQAKERTPASRLIPAQAETDAGAAQILLELVDEDGHMIGAAEKLAAHQPPGQLHRAFSVFLFDQLGHMVLQRRAAGKYHWPGVWSNTCCGHPLPGELPLVAAARRTTQELGRCPARLEEAGTVTYFYEDPSSGLVEREYNHLFIGTIQGDLSPDPNEVDATISVTPQELKRLREQEVFSAWFPTVLQAALPAICRSYPHWEGTLASDRR